MSTLYARKEPTTDSVLLKFEPNTHMMDTVIYTDKECQNKKARFSWYKKGPGESDNQVMLNCYNWPLVWI